MEQYKLLTVTHKHVPLTQLARFFIKQDGDEQQRDLRLAELKDVFQLQELVYLETCNRVVYFFTSSTPADRDFTTQFFEYINPVLSTLDADTGISAVQVYEGLEAVKHLHDIAASLDSMVVGEREILRQLRHAYEHCLQLGLTGDDLRMAFKFAIPAAKRIYTETRIADRPVSVVSLAARALKSAGLSSHSRILLIGAGQSMQLMAKFLKPMGFKSYSVFNRDVSKANKIAEVLGGSGYPLRDLNSFHEDFDVLITCTGANLPIVTPQTYQSLTGGDSKHRLVIDLAIPADVHMDVPAQFPMQYIGMEQLQLQAHENLAIRKEELKKAKELISQFVLEFQQAWQLRQVELMFRYIPSEVQRLRQRAVEEVFAREIGHMDEKDRQTLDKVLDYLERKFSALPVTGARQALKSQLKGDGITRTPLRRVAR